ncbi:hypothetical protein BTVI_10485 [Pitangus sulphuratus]|nr:hypothetical protein BTVI_10485 [Pitangus sulphuratus]
MQLDGTEAKQLASLSWDVGIDEGIGKKTETLSLWRRLLSSMRERHQYTNSLALMSMREGEQTVFQVTTRIRQYEDHLFSSLLTWASAVERLSKTVDRFERLKQVREELSHAPSVWTSLCYWEQVPPNQERGDTPRVDYCDLNKVTRPLSAAVLDMLEFSMNWSPRQQSGANINIANGFFSIALVAECRPQVAFTWRGIQYTWN